jgi:acyl carrier protein
MALQRDNTLREATGVVENKGTALPEELELARLIATTLNLDVNPEDIDPEAPLYGEGLGLDSIDILEISLAISKKYGVKLRSDGADNRQTFRSLRSLCRFIRERRKP